MTIIYLLNKLAYMNIKYYHYFIIMIKSWLSSFKDLIELRNCTTYALPSITDSRNGSLRLLGEGILCGCLNL